jgi:N-acetylmuramoyl-L-alanine amidase
MKRYITFVGIIFGCFLVYFLVNKYVTRDILRKEVIKSEHVKNDIYIENNDMVVDDIVRNSPNSLDNSKVTKNDVKSNIDATEKKVEIKVTEEVKEKVQKKDEEKKEVKESEEKKELKSNKVIVIDPGHASRTSLEKEPIARGSTIMKVKEPGGAQGTVTNTPEYAINMQVALKLKNKLENIGYTVIMTKDKNEIMLGNIKRAEVGNNANADLVIRIHADSSESSSVNGASMLVPANTKYTQSIYEESKKYGQIILNAIISNVGMKNRGVVERDDLTGFNWSKVPIVLIEMGFQSNPEEDRLLCNDDYQNEITKGLVEGVNKIFIP